MKRCDFSDLPTDACAHCRGDQFLPEVRKVRSGAGRPVTARFPGRCAECGEHYLPGTTIRSLDGSWVADCCATEEN